MRQLPKFLRKYFWDVEFQKLDKNFHPRFIIERILEYGDERSVNWMRKNFKLKQIKNVVLNSKNLSSKSANFWCFSFDINNKNKVLCLKKSFQEKQRLVWKP